MLGRAAADVAERSEEFHPATTLPESAPSHGNPALRNDAPKGGLPEPAPTAKNPLPPYGLTGSKTPVSEKPATSTEPKLAVEPATTAHAPSSAPAQVTPGAPTGLPSASLPHGPVAAQPHSGAPGAHSPSPDHYGPVAHMAQSLTSEDLSALNNYTGLGHEDLNDALRTGTMDASQQARVEALNRALEKLPPHSGLVYRGTDLPPEVLAQYQPGAVVTEDAFVSTSVDPAVARSPTFAGNVEFRIVSKTGRDISSLSLISHEQEVLFPSGMQFYVITRTTDPLMGTTIIEMAER
jgi:ADP-ribosyltransferase exoenzyme